ncbi:MAG: hypothetical protein Q4B50_03230, partial [Bacillota bacterium]|nr:hypothetical protein [Bacillota bacterium]
NRPPQPGTAFPGAGALLPMLQQLPPEQLPNIPPPRSAEDLQQLLSHFASILSPENESLLRELIDELQQGGEPAKLQELALRLQQRLR